MIGIAASALADLDEVVTVAQLRVLVILYTRGPVNLAAVAAELDVNPSNASRTCDRLIKAGLLDRRESNTDRRNVTLTLTTAGRKLVDTITRRRRAAIERILAKMAAPERELLAAALDRFADAAGEPVDTDAVHLIWPRGN